MGLPDEIPVSPFFVYRGEIDRFEGVLENMDFRETDRFAPISKLMASTAMCVMYLHRK